MAAKQPTFFGTAISQFAFEVLIFKASATHVARTYEEREAAVHLVPLLPFLSSRAGTCNRKTHRDRLNVALRVVNQIPRNMPIVMTCTCVMQKALFGDILEKMHAFSNIVQLSHSTRPYPRSVSSNVIVVPYFSQSQNSASCANDGLIYWRGSPTVGNRNATRVRRHIMSYHMKDGFDVFGSDRTKCTDTNSLCINGFGAGRDQLAKKIMRENMSKHEFCLVPEGDSPESSRFADAINGLCTPVVISTRIPVLHSNVWRDSIIVIEPKTFLKLSAADVLRQVRAANISCKTRLQLRHETSANMILHRLEELVNKSSFSHVQSVVG